MGIALVLGAGACKRWQVRRPRLRQSRSVLLGPETENISAAVGCARLALRLAPNDAHTTRLLNKIHTTYPDAADESDDHVMGELALQGVPTSPSAEIAICLIMCATDAASDGDKQGGDAPDGARPATWWARRPARRLSNWCARRCRAQCRAQGKARGCGLKRRWRQGRPAMPSKRERKLISKNRSAHH